MTDNPRTPSKTTDNMQNPACHDVNNIKQVGPDTTKTSEKVVQPNIKARETVKPKKPPKPLNAREKNFCLLIDKGLKGQQAVMDAGYNMKGEVATAYSSRLLTKASIKTELERLYKLHENACINDFHTPFVKEFDNSMEVLKELQAQGNDYVRLSATKEILDRVSPKVTRNESVKYTLPAKEKARLAKLIDVTDISQVR